MTFITIIFAVIIWYIYMGYLLMLKLLLMFKKEKIAFFNKDVNNPPKITILVTVHNEERNIEDRINNLLELEYNKDLFEILIASDGSTDGTNEIVIKFQNPCVKLFDSSKQLGKTGAQNLAIQCAKGDFIVFTDARTRFDKMYLHHIAECFTDPNVGAVDGHLLFSFELGNLVSKSQNYYWQYELSLRKAESNLGILAVSSGACLSVRKSLFKNMDVHVGEDCVVPLDVIEQGYKVVHAEDAFAYDQMQNAPEEEFNSRIRMTVRNWQGTWFHAKLLNPFINPQIALSLWSHKLLRWLSPLFIIFLVLSANIGAVFGSTFCFFTALAVDSFIALGLIGCFTINSKIKIPLVGIIYSFFVANAGFLVGFLYVMLGHKIHIYKN